MAYVANYGVVASARLTVSVGARLCTRSERVSTALAVNAGNAAFNMLMTAFACANLMLFIAYNNGLSCVS